MNEAVKVMLSRYQNKTTSDHERALHEIIQEIALLGLWRGKFFEHATCYGGTALRILYGLDRFSEDLDFSLLKKNKGFKLEKYFPFVRDELEAYGFQVEIESVEKKTSAIDSAFIKTNTLVQLIKIQDDPAIPKNKKIQIKFEVDKEPPLGFSTESQLVLQPTPFYVQTMVKEDLFAGKMHALLFRNWKHRQKGRDWYDFVWYLSQGISLHLEHFKKRSIQSGHINEKTSLDRKILFDMFEERIQRIDIDMIKRDVRPFVLDSRKIEIWSKQFFLDLMKKIKIV